MSSSIRTWLVVDETRTCSSPGLVSVPGMLLVVVDKLVHRRARAPRPGCPGCRTATERAALCRAPRPVIFTSIWKDGDFLSLPPSAQRLYMFLLSQPELTYCGTMPLRPARPGPEGGRADAGRHRAGPEGSGGFGLPFGRPP